MSERDEERRGDAVAWLMVSSSIPPALDSEPYLQAHLAGQLCGERRAAEEIAALRGIIEVWQREVGGRESEIAALREAVRMIDSFIGSPSDIDLWCEWTKLPAVVRALDEKP
jgi:hypothetical protein